MYVHYIFDVFDKGTHGIQSTLQLNCCQSATWKPLIKTVFSLKIDVFHKLQSISNVLIKQIVLFKNMFQNLNQPNMIL